MARSVRVFLYAILFLIFLCPQAFALICGKKILIEHEGGTFELAPTRGGSGDKERCGWQDTFYIGAIDTNRIYRLVSYDVNDYRLDNWSLEVYGNDYLYETSCGRNYDRFKGPAVTDLTDPSGLYVFDSDSHLVKEQCGCDPNIKITLIPINFCAKIEPEGAGTVSFSPEKVYSINDVVTAKAIPGADWVFDKWKSPSQSVVNPLSYTFYGWTNTTFHAVFRDSQIRMEPGSGNPSEGYFNPYGGERQVLANHFKLTNKVSENAVISDMGFQIEGDLTLLAGATLIRDEGCTGSG
ncbi:MAG: hypothetical protein JW950_14445, partial [Deltaproteobacteria bacterium]|nr:hypothetical protein [Deltaproteobacteria bacterium]